MNQISSIRRDSIFQLFQKKKASIVIFSSFGFLFAAKAQYPYENYFEKDFNLVNLQTLKGYMKTTFLARSLIFERKKSFSIGSFQRNFPCQALIQMEVPPNRE